MAIRRYVSAGWRWVIGLELPILVALLLVVGGAWAFIAIADEVREGDTQKFDERVLLALRHPDDPATPIGPKWLTSVALDTTALGSPTVLVLMTGAVVGHLLILGLRKDAGFLCVAAAGGMLVSGVLKYTFQRDRPTVVGHLAQVMSSSFPSGHAMLSAVIFMTLGVMLASEVDSRRAKVYYLSLAVILSFAVGLTRIFLGVHYPTDVLAGWSAGLTWAVLCRLVLMWIGRQKPLPAHET